MPEELPLWVTSRLSAVYHLGGCFRPEADISGGKCNALNVITSRLIRRKSARWGRHLFTRWDIGFDEWLRISSARSNRRWNFSRTRRRRFHCNWPLISVTMAARFLRARGPNKIGASHCPRLHISHRDCRIMTPEVQHELFSNNC
jgi:hypothetical protein